MTVAKATEGREGIRSPVVPGSSGVVFRVLTFTSCFYLCRLTGSYGNINIVASARVSSLCLIFSFTKISEINYDCEEGIE